MSPLNQNLFLFFEENENQSVIDRKLIKMFMNRCIIDDDANFEIAGVYELQQVNDLMFNHLHPLFKRNAHQRTKKEALDRDIFTKAVKKTFVEEPNSTDSHFIIGSSFHSLDVSVAKKRPKFINRRADLLDWLLNKVKSQKLRSLHVTFLTGNRYELITREMHKKLYTGSIYNGGGNASYVAFPGGRKVSVNEDFELTIKLIGQGRRLQHTMPLLFHPMLNPYELDLLQKKDKHFLRSFKRLRHNDDFITAKEFHVQFFPNCDPSLEFIDCFCLRQSYYLRP